MGERLEEGTMAVALYDFPGIREDNLSFRKGEILTIVEMNETGWWKGTNINGEVGIFPYNYVAALNELQSEGFKIYKTTASYESDAKDEITFQKDTLLTLIKPINSDWAWGRIYSLPGQTKRLQHRVVGKFKMSLVEETNLLDIEAGEEEKLEAKQIEEQTRVAATKIQEEKKVLAAETEVIERIAAKKTNLQIERETLRRENEKLQQELARMKRELAEKEAAAKQAEEQHLAALAEKARIEIIAEKQENPTERKKRSELVEQKANKSYRNNVDKDGFAAPPPRRKKFAVASRFSKLGKGGDVCKICERAVAMGPFSIKAMGSIWHKECFKCGTCGKILRGEWLEHSGFPYCNKCHKAAFGIKGFGYGGAVAGNYNRT